MIPRDEATRALREAIAEGEWEDRLPPLTKLHQQLGCSRETVEAALRVLIAEGLVVKRGTRHHLASAEVVDADAITARRVSLIQALCISGLTRHTFGRLLPTDQHKLAGASGDRGYSMLQLAVDTLRTPAHGAVRAALGHHEVTRGLATTSERRQAYGRHIHRGVVKVARAERRGAHELAGHLESLQILRDQGLLDPQMAGEAIGLRQVAAQLGELERRTRNLEQSALELPQ